MSRFAWPASDEPCVGISDDLCESCSPTRTVASFMTSIAIAATRAVPCPTIGIGASAQCDGQVLVTEDMLGMFDRVPRFVKRYEEIAQVIGRAAEAYAGEVRARTFPGIEQTYQPK